ncbi:MAG: hypothetical protein R2932_47885 [Caldilineaceae bacterium]
MSTTVVRYAYSCGFLQTAISAFLYLLEENQALHDKEIRPIVLERWRELNSVSERLSRWLLEEIMMLDQSFNSISSAEVGDIYSSLEPLGDEFTYSFCDKLDMDVRSFYQSLKLLQPGVLVYFFYCGTMYSLLTAFDEMISLVNQDRLDDSEFQKGHDLRNDFQSGLGSELASIDRITSLTTDESNKVREAIQCTSLALTQDWRIAIAKAVTLFIEKAS